LERNAPRFRRRADPSDARPRFPRLDGRCTACGTHADTNLKAICERDEKLAA
jgi:hypothetical protein